ncbi:DUF4912 domain-containing protein [Brevibacillus laterosporus]|uniref:DUF4912 domain-containing protein n=1 Tax=Brevibacillus laterosporus TaxID=1465 RepID=A0A502IP24_BRELA|nr:DUF4912 domain-containing protein [Brevibacillus laterosporus]QDX95136.1 DUF4912 domain-containing protein [Brevibacillus laterosporus]RAP26542.1 hypothetical protein C2W64_01498 [Brevibacillus laterosporus]TPG69046.1 DUF4912 domain-containing protein [Brevibacillus laterosporus]TPG88579.1 DUF4912 domain-containing protein [Brevibacillus laterosporus]
MITKILQMRAQSLSLQEISTRCGMTIGQVKYQLHKFGLKSQADGENKGITEAIFVNLFMGKVVSPPFYPPVYPLETDKGDSYTTQAKGFLAEQMQGQAQQEEKRVPVITVIPTAPETVYVHWYISKYRLHMIAGYLNEDWTNIKQGIRLYELEEGVTSRREVGYKDVYIRGEAESCYVEHLQVGKQYVAEFGLYASGQFCPIMRSEGVTLTSYRYAAW